MSNKELVVLQTVRDVESRRLTQREAAKRLDVTDRTVRRWQTTVRTEGPSGLAHGNRGQESPRKVPKKERDKIVFLILSKYPDFGPTLATEKLSELHNIVRDPTTIRDIMVEESIWIPRAKRCGASPVVHRAWRERKAYFGELVQFDGSYHDWFEGRGGLEGQCLLAAVDDATGEILSAEFAPNEGVLPVMGFWTKYTVVHGLPKAVYTDRFSTYKMTQKVAVENHDVKTQLERAFKTVGIEPIFALSPEAKGRVERLFGTLQDRLVKELRLRNISDSETANRFMAKTFIPSFNKKFRVEPRASADFHRRFSDRELKELPETFCRMSDRRVMNDFTVSFKNQWYQIMPTRRLAVRSKDKVLVREYPDGALSFSIRNKQVEIKPIFKQRQSTRILARLPVRTLVPA